jgi:hypothetical protein
LDFRPGSNPSHEEPNPMTQADSVLSTPPTNTSLSRRNILGTAAAAALAATGASPMAAAPGPDPIFAALDAFRLAEAAFYAERSGDIPDEIGDRWSDAVDVVIRTQPTTPAGLGALTGFARDMAERSNRGDAGLPDEGWVPVMAAIDDAARGMSGLESWSPPLLAAPAADPIYAVIERHKAAGIVWNAAVDVRAPEPMTDKKSNLLDDAVDDARSTLEQTGVDLINTQRCRHRHRDPVYAKADARRRHLHAV